MKDFKKTLKTLLFSIVLAALSLSTTNLHAQDYSFNRGLLDKGPDASFKMPDYNQGMWNRGDSDPIMVWSVLNLTDPTQPAPLGSGVLILVAAGAGYAIVRRKHTRKGASHTSSTLLLAAAMLLGLTQCKKEVETVNPVAADGIPMTLNAYNDSRTSFDGSGAISWGTNEKIYVVYNGTCIGSVTNGTGGGNTFTGTVTGLESGNDYTLHYYYVGTAQTIATDATSFSMDFVNQDGTMANLGKFHIGHGTQTLTYEGGDITSEAGMSSLVSIGYFDIAGMAEVGENVYMYGENLNNKITIDFSTNKVTNTKVEGDNLICLGAVTEGSTCGKYVMLVPNHTDGTETLATNITFISKRTSGTCNNTFNYGIIANRFYCKGGNTSTPIDVAVTEYQPGTLRGLFTINDSGDQVQFSQGNLKCTTTDSWNSWTWSFMVNQYDIDEAGSVGDNYESRDYISHFGWGCTGYIDDRTVYYPEKTAFYCYKPYDTYPVGYYSEVNRTYFYGPSVDVNADGWMDDDDIFYNLTVENKSDWGYCINEGNDGWYTLSLDELLYIVTSSGRENGRYFRGLAKIGSINGFVILPDDSDTDLINNSNQYFSNNEYTISEWLKLEALGAVFLPASGCRSGYIISDYEEKGHYWTTNYDDNDMCVSFDFAEEDGMSIPVQNKNWGGSVRLVRSVE